MQTFIDKYGAKLLTAIGQHIVYVVISVLIAAVIGLALAVFLSRFRKAAGIIMPLVSVFQTIPGIVFIGVLMLKNGPYFLQKFKTKGLLFPCSCFILNARSHSHSCTG